MSGPQFIHIETYGRAGSVLKGSARAEEGEVRVRGDVGRGARAIVAEALRESGNMPHVPLPQPPTTLFGDLRRLANDLAALGVKAPPGQRKDTPILLAGVLSAPWPPGDERSAAWRRDALHYLHVLYGCRLRAVVAHEDEAYDHLHFYVALEEWAPVRALHPGKVAQAEAKAAKLVAKDQRAAYNAAMRAFQDHYHSEVARWHGMTRIGPGRRRVSARVVWQLEKLQGNALKDAQATANQVIENARSTETEVQATVNAMLSEAFEKAKMASEAETRAKKMVEDALSRVQALTIAPFEPIPEVTVSMPPPLRPAPPQPLSSADVLASERVRAWQVEAKAWSRQRDAYLVQLSERSTALERVALQYQLQAKLASDLKLQLEKYRVQGEVETLFTRQEIAERRIARRMAAQTAEATRRRSPEALNALRRNAVGVDAVWIGALDTELEEKPIGAVGLRGLEQQVATEAIKKGYSVEQVEDALWRLSPLRSESTSECRDDLLNLVLSQAHFLERRLAQHHDENQESEPGKPSDGYDPF